MQAGSVHEECEFYCTAILNYIAVEYRYKQQRRFSDFCISSCTPLTTNVDEERAEEEQSWM